MTRFYWFAIVTMFALVLFTDIRSVPVEAQVGRSPVACGLSAVIDTAAASTLQTVALAAGRRIHVCGFVLTGGGATSVRFVRGTGANCGTGTTNVSGPMELGDNTVIPYGGGEGAVFILPAGQALCLTNSAAIQVSGIVSYTR